MLKVVHEYDAFAMLLHCKFAWDAVHSGPELRGVCVARPTIVIPAERSGGATDCGDITGEKRAEKTKVGQPRDYYAMRAMQPLKTTMGRGSARITDG